MVQLSGHGKDSFTPPKERSIVWLFPLYAIIGSFRSNTDEHKSSKVDVSHKDERGHCHTQAHGSAYSVHILR
jgi:hypothetical protein